jgi:uncharacterized membrane protein YqaE (UPF0057 family)
MSVFDIILAIVLPPIPVALRYGMSNKLIINILLTMIGWIPGVIHALYVLSKKPAEPSLER